MKNIRKTIEMAMREGLTLDEVYQIANIISENLVREQEKEDKVAKSRLKAAEALSEYINLVSGKNVADVEEAYEILKANDEVLCELFEAEDSISRTLSSNPEVILTTTPLSEEEMQSLKTDFAAFAKRLGF